PPKSRQVGGSYDALASVADRASKASGDICPHHECRRLVLYLMHQRKTSCRQFSGLPKTFLFRRTSLFSVELNDSAITLSALVPTAPIDWVTPSSVQRAPNAEEVYTLP